MEPNLLPFAVQYDLAVGAFAKNQVAEKALEYTVKWIAEHPEAIENEARIVDQLRRFRLDNPENISKIREAFNNLKIIRNACAARDIKNSLPQGSSWRDFTDFMRQAYTSMRGSFGTMASNFMRFGANMFRSAKEIGIGLGAFAAGMASGAGTWISAMLADAEITMSGLLGGLAAIALVLLLLAVADYFYRRNRKPFQPDTVFESWSGRQPHIPYRPQQI
jgi:hypothetical protein